MTEKIKQLRVLTLAVGCGVIVLSASLCGCESQADRDAAKKDAVDGDFAGCSKLASVCYEEGQYAKAIAAWKSAIALKPDLARAHHNKGSAYGNLGQYALAIAAWKKAVAIDPTHARAHLNTGIAHARLKQHALAIAAFEKAIAIEPKSPTADEAREGIRRARRR